MLFHSDAGLCTWILCLSISLAAFPMPAIATTEPSTSDLIACDAPSPLLPTDAHRRPEGAMAETHCYRLDLPSAGLLHLDLSVAGGSPSRGQLSAGARAALETIERSATEWLATAPAGTYFFEVAAEDPRRPLPAYRLSSRFVELAKSDDDGELELDPETLLKSDDDGELELDPETFRIASGDPGGATSEIACLNDLPGKSDDDGELELDPETSRATGVGSLCPGGDDHGDSRVCATPIERSPGGELGNGWGDDADVFRFRLCGWQTLEIATAGDADTYGQLYDRAGQLLAGDDDGGEGGNFRLVRTLGPGTYFVRVEGVQSTGAYTLAMGSAGR